MGRDFRAALVVGRQVDPKDVAKWAKTAGPTARAFLAQSATVAAENIIDKDEELAEMIDRVDDKGGEPSTSASTTAASSSSTVDGGGGDSGGGRKRGREETDLFSLTSLKQLTFVESGWEADGVHLTLRVDLGEAQLPGDGVSPALPIASVLAVLSNQEALDTFRAVYRGITGKDGEPEVYVVLKEQ